MPEPSCENNLPNSTPGASGRGKIPPYCGPVLGKNPHLPRFAFTRRHSRCGGCLFRCQSSFRRWWWCQPTLQYYAVRRSAAGGQRLVLELPRPFLRLAGELQGRICTTVIAVSAAGAAEFKQRSASGAFWASQSPGRLTFWAMRRAVLATAWPLALPQPAQSILAILLHCLAAQPAWASPGL